MHVQSQYGKMVEVFAFRRFDCLPLEVPNLELIIFFGTALGKMRVKVFKVSNTLVVFLRT